MVVMFVGVVVTAIEPAGFKGDGGACEAVVFGMGVGGEGAGPGDVAMAGGVEGVAAFGEDPAGAGVDFAQGEVIGGDVLFGCWGSVFRRRRAGS